MSVVLLERTFSVENPKVVAMQRTDRIASASAMSGDLTNVWISDPREGDVRGGPEKIYPNSAVFLFEFQAPSVLQVIDTASSVLLDDCSGENRVPAGDKLDLLLFSCANDHSLDNLSPFSAVSSGVISLSSKTSVFLVVQMVQQIHGRMLKVTPECGRHIADRNLTTTSLKEQSTTMWTARRNGTQLQTLIAKGQLKKVCVLVSWSWHLRQGVAESIPLFCRFAFRGRAFCAIDQRKAHIFGENLPVQMSFIQLNCSNWLFIGNTGHEDDAVK